MATIGPASTSPDVIRKLVMAGMNVARLNFSHGTHEQHARMVETIRGIAQDLGNPVAILGDLQGPRIRIGLRPGAWRRCRLALSPRPTNSKNIIFRRKDTKILLDKIS